MILTLSTARGSRIVLTCFFRGAMLRRRNSASTPRVVQAFFGDPGLLTFNVNLMLLERQGGQLTLTSSSSVSTTVGCSLFWGARQAVFKSSCFSAQIGRD